MAVAKVSTPAWLADSGVGCISCRLGAVAPMTTTLPAKLGKVALTFAPSAWAKTSANENLG